MELPKEFEWLYKELGPRILIEALKDYGLKETPGTANTQVIMKWAKDLGIDWYTADSIPWCGLTVGAWAKHAGYPYNKNLLLQAVSWEKWGNAIAKTDAKLGDVLTFVRTGGGHVGLYIGEDKDSFCILGGNQGDAVSFTWIAKTRLHSVSRSPFVVGQPANIRKIQLKRTGELSKNEA